MKLSALHNAVRALARGEQPDAETLSQLSASERKALASLRRRIQHVAGDLQSIQVQTASAEWMVPGKQTQVA